jgi:Tol biopolymer transport system component
MTAHRRERQMVMARTLSLLAFVVLALGVLVVAPTGATPPGQNGKIVWQVGVDYTPKVAERLPHLFVANADGTDARRVFDADNRGEIEGTFSPTDPNLMFFSRFKPHGRFGEDLFSGNLATGDVELIRGTKSAEVAPSVSPDGTQLAYVSRHDRFRRGPASGERIHIVNVDGSGDHAITPGRQRSSDPDWSPDGSQIVYSQTRFERERDRVEYTEFNRLVVINADGTGRRPLTKFGRGVNPKWMPDGKTIVYERSGVGRLPGIATIDVADGSKDVVLETNASETNPVPSPDGTRIVFTSNRDTLDLRRGWLDEVYTMAIDGSDIERVTNDRRTDTFPDWQRLP